LTFQVARFFTVSPEEVENWQQRYFLDRVEYMLLEQEIDQQLREYEEKKSKGNR